MKFGSCLLCFLLSFSLFGQRDELLEDISLATCECIKTADPEVDFEMMVGLCMLQGSSPVKEKVNTILGLDLKDTDNYEKLGSMLAPTLVANCPEFTELMMSIEGLEEDETEEEKPETWSDMEGGEREEVPEYGGPQNKKFITTPMPDTNGAGLIKPTVTGKVKTITAGLASEIILRGSDGQTYTLYLEERVAGAEKLRKGKSVTIIYREEMRFHAAAGKRVVVKLISEVE